jgi:hypothetical protein
VIQLTASVVDYLVEQFEHVHDFIAGVLEAIEGKLGKSVFKTAIRLDLHLDLIEGDQL